MTNPILERTLLQIQDEFRQERKDRKHILLQALRVKALVEGERHEFTEACKLMNITPPQVEQAFLWLQDDNVRMNIVYDSSVHSLKPHEYMMIGWFNDQANAKVIKFGEVA